MYTMSQGTCYVYFHHIHYTYFRNIVFLLRVELWERRKVLLDFPQEGWTISPSLMKAYIIRRLIKICTNPKNTYSFRIKPYQHSILVSFGWKYIHTATWLARINILNSMVMVYIFHLHCAVFKRRVTSCDNLEGLCIESTVQSCLNESACKHKRKWKL